MNFCKECTGNRLTCNEARMARPAPEAMAVDVYSTVSRFGFPINVRTDYEHVMIAIKPETPLIFAGSDEPAAFVRLKSIGLPKVRGTDFSEKICGFVQQEPKVPPYRVFIDFKDLEREMFGWNEKTF